MRDKSSGKIILSHIGRFTKNPWLCSEIESAFSFSRKEALVISPEGRILEICDSIRAISRHPNYEIVNYSDYVLLPGFVDCHLHMPQLDMIGAYGKDLLGWLNQYTFPTESRFSEESLCEETANRLCQELRLNGITTASAFATFSIESVEAMFSAAEQSGLRLLTGKVSMDQNVPEALMGSLSLELEATEFLINKWHNKNQRLKYSLTPRFAPSCSPKLLQSLGDLRERHPDVRVQSHVGETEAEVAWVKELYPKSKNYLGVYEDYGLGGDKSILAHGIYLNPDEKRQLSQNGGSIAHCPSSNLFLGSGLCDIQSLVEMGVPVGLGSDIGAGTSLNMWQTMAQAYQTSAMLKKPTHPLRLLYLATAGGAEALGLEEETGSLVPGKYADFQILDLRKNRLLNKRFEKSLEDFPEHLLATMCLGDDRITKAVYVAGSIV